ncbi:GntR family transcriptional regulator [Lactobacillus hominis]|uniref:UbiC transcription regulator-associated n=1 Tax=Lactobacillus hominis DSM 23910 = CRBIP 24.179 TaxID=1423758 RepID=I7IVF1_9LACO|nr:GntR family transcriptional regulator [Lactobacillus hominis]KRM85254.1 transcriptional regulator [Lactobacillus hominis DSM 23910 = CRBIP 24.179]MCT3347670.1 GntR family transcriptional regulator [Lactobacillus hominis]CCI81333.1 UbiC transcription regulator-associated [Lactobacillus hominis DSM 23910 = CRBIP 24.179]
MKKYQLVASKIRNYIIDNNLKHGTQLPKITKLMEEFDVGKSTVLQALTLLDQEGSVYKIQGSGIFVRRPPEKGYMSLGADWGFSHAFNDNIHKINVKVSQVDKPPVELAKNVFPLEPCYKVVRTVVKNADEPLLQEESYYLKEYVPFLTKEIAEGSIFSYLQKALKLEIRFSDQYMEIRKLNDFEAKALQLSTGDPTLQIKELHYLANGEVFDLAKLVYNYKNVKFINQSPDKII